MLKSSVRSGGASVLTALRRPKDPKLKTSLDYMLRSCLYILKKSLMKEYPFWVFAHFVFKY